MCVCDTAFNLYKTTHGIFHILLYRTKVIVLTVEELLNPNPTEGILESFHQPFEPTDGYALLCLLQAWAQKKDSIWTI